MKVVIVSEIGSGFDLSDKMCEELIEMGIDYYEDREQIKNSQTLPFICVNKFKCFGLGKYWSNFYDYQFRTNPLLIKVVEE